MTTGDRVGKAGAEQSTGVDDSQPVEPGRKVN